jgi:ferric-dicitrate binding protein FerR (iron transport regulator)
MKQELLHPEEIDMLIINFLSKEISNEERTALQNWIMQSDDNRQYFIQMQDLWKSISHDEVSFDSEQAYKRFVKRIEASRRVSRSGHKGRFLKWAAVFVLAFGLGSLSFYIANQRSLDNHFYAIDVPYGAKSRVELPDKSVVWLNAGSTMHYAQSFGKNNRDVSLDGEAYFEVSKNRHLPFTVHGKEVSVKVLGTKFNVKSYAEDSVVDVTLIEGSVDLKNNLVADSRVILKPNERATLNKRTEHLMVNNVEASNSREWTNGKLIFEEELFGQIVRRLEREYNVKIIVNDPSLNTLRFYGDFRNAQSIGEIFDIMTANNKFRYTIRKSVINVYK